MNQGSASVTIITKEGYSCIVSPCLNETMITFIINECISKESESLHASYFENRRAFENGRGPMFLFPLSRISENSRSVILRKGRRGGAVSRFIKSSYVMNPVMYPSYTRMWKEFVCLEKLRKVGVRVPEPAFAAVRKKGLVFYEGYLSLYVVPDAVNFMDYLEKKKEDLLPVLSIAFDVGLEARKMLEAGVLHVDLHLGNVLLGGAGVYLIDFDNAEYFSVSDQSVAAKKQFLIDRWRRSVQKRISSKSVSELLIRGFERGLLCP
jgi:tRNA A-37 threonylcarbamoyl transferase component Bud32